MSICHHITVIIFLILCLRLQLHSLVFHFLVLFPELKMSLMQLLGTSEYLDVNY